MVRNISFQQLEARRKRWNAYEMPTTPLEIEDNESLNLTVSKVIGIGLHLELPVAEWVGQASKKELPIGSDAKRTLARNIKDEAIHFDAFTFASQAYKVPDDVIEECRYIGEAWGDNNSHPLEKAAVAEAGVFINSLFILSVFGGQSLANMANNVLFDEWGHIAANWGILESLDFSRATITPSVDNLRLETLDFIFGGLRIKELGIDRDFMIQESANLLSTGYSQELEELSAHSVYSPPFESPNNRLY